MAANPELLNAKHKMFKGFSLWGPNGEDTPFSEEVTQKFLPGAKQ